MDQLCEKFRNIFERSVAVPLIRYLHPQKIIDKIFFQSSYFIEVHAINLWKFLVKFKSFLIGIGKLLKNFRHDKLFHAECLIKTIQFCEYCRRCHNFVRISHYYRKHR